MATRTTTDSSITGSAPLASSAFDRFAGLCAMLVGIANFFYAVSFVILKNGILIALFLMLSGLLATAALTALYSRLRATDASFSLWALLLALAGAFGSAVHGGYDLANAINPQAAATSIAALPNFVDPRGLLTFGVAGIGLFVISWLMGRTEREQFPRWPGYLGYLLAFLLVVLYLGRLVIYNPANPIVLVPAILSGFIISPLWYIWLGVVLLRR